MIIGITGLKHSGKDTLGEYLRLLTNCKYQVKHFAVPVKKITCEFIGETLKELEEKKDSDELIYGRTRREWMQFIGTEFGRAINVNIWVDRLFKEYNSNTNWIIADCRFQNELDKIKEKGGYTIKITRNVPVTEHSSERSVLTLDTDYTIPNDTTKEDLYERAKWILNKINDRVTKESI